MKVLLALLFLLPVAALAQSPFNGTWIIDTDTTQLPQKPATYLLANGKFHWSGQEINADGTDQRVSETGYWDTLSAQVVNDHTVEIISKKAGKTMFSEVDTVSADGRTLTQLVRDTTEAEAVTIETISKRVGEAPAGSHVLSGSWQAYKINKSKNGSTIRYKCTAEGFSAMPMRGAKSAWSPRETPLGEKFDAKFDGNYYPVADDPAHTMVSLRLLNPTSVEQTAKRDGKIVGVLRLTVALDGKTIHGTYENKETDTTTSFEMRKQPN